MEQAQVTTDHDEIQRWVEARGGCPAMVSRTARGGGGVLRIDFPGYSGRTTLKRIPWDQFFGIFDERGLAFLYQDRTTGGRESRFSKIVSQESAASRGGGSARAGSARAGRVGGTARSSRAGGSTRSSRAGDGTRSRGVGGSARSGAQSK